MSTSATMGTDGPGADTTAARRRIVVGVDGSPSSIDALRWAAGTAADIGAEIDAVTCWQYPTSAGMVPGLVGWDPVNDAERILADALSQAFGDKLPDGLVTSVRNGHPAQCLIEAGEGAAMLVVGSRGHGGFLGLLLGSVSATCAEHATCPVVITRHGAGASDEPHDPVPQTV